MKKYQFSKKNLSSTSTKLVSSLLVTSVENANGKFFLKEETTLEIYNMRNLKLT